LHLPSKMLAVLVLAALSAPSVSAQALTPGSFQAFSPSGEPPRISNFSGLPVPRYSSLKASEVNGRAGPSADYPVEWSYRRTGLPVVIVRESGDWRKIRDPMGDEVWVHRSMLGSARTTITTQSGVVRRDADSRSPVLASFGAGAVLTLGDCNEDWCGVESGGHKGWVARRMLWGADDLAGE
jgi:SH3-like domain-containing protein